MRSSLLIASTILVATACTPGQLTEGAPTSELSEVSMNFDLEDLEPLLREIAGKWDGFGAAEVEAVLNDVRSMDVDDEREWRFTVRRNGRDVPLVLRVFLDDVAAPDLYLLSVADVAEQLQRDLGAFSDRRGK